MSTKGERRRDSVPLILQQVKSEPEPVVLNWLGSLRKRTTSNGPRYGIQAQFRRVGMIDSAFETTIPMEAFHLLAVGSRWSYGVFNGYSGTRTAWVQLDMSALDIEGRHRACHPHKVMDDWTYPLHGMMNPGAVRLMPLVGGREIVFPIAEMVRVWYLFHPAMLRVALGDGLANPRSMAKSDLPWDPDRTYRTPDGVHVTYDTSFGDGPMKRLARLLFDPQAKQKAGSFSRRLRQYSEKDSFPLPYTLPPLEQHPLIQIQYTALEEGDDRPERYLVLSVLGVRYPPPFKSFTFDPIHDNSPDPNADPNRPVMAPLGSPAIVTDAEGVTLAGESADSRVESVRTHLLAFDDDIYDVPTKRAPRRPSSHRAGGRAPDPVHVHQVGPDTGAARGSGVAEIAGGDMLAPPSEENTRKPIPVALIQMRAVFDRAIEMLSGQLPGWTVDYLSLPGMEHGVFEITHESRANYCFMIIHARSPGRHVYALHGAPVGNIRSRHQLFACRQPSGQALTSQQFTRWLDGVPYLGRPIWVDKEPGGLRLIPGAFNHQEDEVPFDEAVWIEKFAAKVAKAVKAIAFG